MTNEKALAKALKLATLDELLIGAQRYAQDPNRKPDYTKMPATWLNKGCWNDPPLPGTSKPKGQTFLETFRQERTERTALN